MEKKNNTDTGATTQNISITKDQLRDLYSTGEYLKVIESIKAIPQRNFFLDQTLNMSFTKANMTDKGALHFIEMFQRMINYPENSDDFKQYLHYARTANVPQTALRIMRELDDMKAFEPYSFLPKEHHIILDTIVNTATKYRNNNVLLFIAIWPLAYGDMIIYNQFIKYYKEQFNLPVVVAIPVNRPELKELFGMNDSIDTLIDITLLPEEKDRGLTLNLGNGPFLNVSIQEYLLRYLFSVFMQNNIKTEIIKNRYFPVFMPYGVYSTKRLWEERARLWLEDKYELPKLVESKQEKEDCIVLHLRSGGYGELMRDVPDNYAQDFIKALRQAFPGYKIVRIGDPSMTPMIDCLDKLDAPLEEQIQWIQKAKLFIGSHSAPQHLAVACSDTPVVCINYTAQETTLSMDDNIARLSYEPIGEQVKKIFYVKMYDVEGRKLIPQQLRRDVVNYDFQKIPDIIDIAKEILSEA